MAATKKLTKKIKRGLQGKSPGVGLIEVLIAVALLGILSVAFMSALATGSRVLVVADERTTAGSLARRQMEYVKNQPYNRASPNNNYKPTYQKISSIPAGYSIWSVNCTGAIVSDIVGIPWDSQSNRPVDNNCLNPTDKGLQKIALVIKYEKPNGEERIIYTFINNNTYWAHGVPITLEGYKTDR